MTEEQKDEKLIERAKHLMEQRKIYNARARAKVRACKEANGIEIRAARTAAKAQRGCSHATQRTPKETSARA